VVICSGIHNCPTVPHIVVSKEGSKAEVSEGAWWTGVDGGK